MPRPPITRSAKDQGAHPSFANLVYAATVQLDPAAARTQFITLTGAITFSAPLGRIIGDRMVVVIQQDATGGRNVSWNAAFKNPPTISGRAANAVDAPEFVYNGTNWVYIA